MRLRDDTRGVTVQVGAILLFGVLVILLSIYQAQVVPAQNEGTEFQHSQAVQNDMVQLRNGLIRSAASGDSYPTSVKLGTTYQPRIFFVNPPPVSGQFRTAPLGNVTIQNAHASGDVGQFWNGTSKNYSTRKVVYSASYTYLQRHTITYENTGVFRKYDTGTVTDAAPTFVDGNQLTIITIQGTYSRAGVEAAAVDPKVVSGPTQTTRISSANASTPLEITIPTSLSEAQWESVFANTGEWDPDDSDSGAHVRDVTDAAPDDGEVTVVLDPGEYNLRMGSIGLGAGVRANEGADDAAYIVKQSGNGSVMQAGARQMMTAQVRDRYNNRVPGVPIDAETNGTKNANNGTVKVINGGTRDDGVVELRYTAPSDMPAGATRTYNVTAWFDTGVAGSHANRTAYEVAVWKPASTRSISVVNARQGAQTGNVTFDMRNAGTADAVLTRLAVVNSSADVNQVENGGSATVRASGATVYSTAISIGGAAADIQDATIPSQSAIQVSLTLFKKNKNVRSMSGQTVELRLYFSDGSEETITFTVS